MSSTFLDSLPTRNTKSTMKKKKRQQFIGSEAAEQEEGL